MKRAQTISQVFIFILGAVIFITILLYGYKGVKRFTSQSETVMLVDFERELTDAVQAIRLEYGSVRIVNFQVPSKYKGICFVTGTPPASFEASFPLIAEVAEGATQNVFLIPLAERSLMVDGLTTDGGCHCTNITRGRFTLRLESLGNQVKVTDRATGKSQC